MKQLWGHGTGLCLGCGLIPFPVTMDNETVPTLFIPVRSDVVIY